MRWLLLLLVLSAGIAQSQEPPKAPRVEAKQKAENSPKSQDQSKAIPPVAEPAATAPPQTTQAKTSKAGEHAQNSGEEGTEFWSPFFGYRLKVTDTLLVLFTAMVFGATWLLWRATDKLVTGAEDTARRQLRAYVGIEKLESEWGRPQGDLVTTVRVKNSGQTPAYNVVLRNTVALVSTVGPRTFEEPPENARRPMSTLAAGGATEMLPKTNELTDRDCAAIRSGIMNLYLYGRIDYTDVFKIAQYTTFRAYFHPGKSRWRHCDEGNEAT